MKKQNICPICSNILNKREASFAFPRLPVTSKHQKLAGIVHVSCLIESSEVKNIRQELSEILKKTLSVSNYSARW